MEYQSKLIKCLKYFVVFFVTYLIITYIPSTKIEMSEIFMISMLISVLFAFLDMYFPSVTIEKIKS